MNRIIHIYLSLLASAAATGLYAQVDTFDIPYGIEADTIPFDSTRQNELAFIVMSPDSIDAKVEYGSVDSNYLDNASRRVYLFGDAYVRYKDLSLKADYIVVDLDSSIATAEGVLDSLGGLKGKPQFNMADESFTAEKIRYNFKSRKGFIYNVLTEEGDLLIHGDKTKFVASTSEPGRKDDILYNEGALITSCDHPVPHYGIRARKVKTIPDRLAVVGASNLELFGVPTPLWLPFGFYPVSETRKAGIIFPRDYERSPSQGFGLREFGYYLPIKEWADLKLVGDIYFNGSWGLGATSNYVKKYKFRGNVDLRYSNRISELPGDYRTAKEKSFSIRLTHTQDPKAHPYQNIGGSVNIQSNDYESLNYNDAESALTNSYSSNLNYSRTFPGKPYSFTAGITHSQNTRSHTVEINAPELNFRLNRIYPFKNKNRPGPDQWYEKIAFQYSGQGKSKITSTDTTLFDASTWENAQWGAQHRASASTNFTALKYFNFTPSVDYGETWFFKTREKAFRFDPTDADFVSNDTVFFPDGTGFYLQPDTINYGIWKDSLVSNFQPFRSMSASINMNTQIFGLMEFKKGWIRGIRHVIKPNIGFSYAPALGDSTNFFKEQKFSVAFPDSLRRYSRFENLLFSANPLLEDQANINFSLTNLFEAKYFSRRDSTEKKLKLFDNINVSGSYNIAATINRWSPININGNTRFFKGVTTVSVGATYSFYDLEDNGRLSPVFYSKNTGHLLRFDNLRLRFSTRLTYQDILSLFSNKESTDPVPASEVTPAAQNKLPTAKDKFFDLLSRFSINHELGIMRFGMPGVDTTIISTNSINMVGSMQITPNWSLIFGNIGYDFRSKQLTYPDIGLARDLHCWQLSFNFQPTRGTYSFHIGVKPGSFDFLKFPYRRGNYDIPSGF